MSLLIAGLRFFLGVHLVPAFVGGRASLVQRWGEQRYKGIFTLISFAGLALIIAGYASATPGAPLFAPSQAAIAPYAMTLSLVLFAAANMRTYIRQLVRHPMLLGLAIWATVHLLANERHSRHAPVRKLSRLRRDRFRFGRAAPRRQAVHPDHASRRDRGDCGVVAALALMALHRPLFGVAVVHWGIGGG